MKVTLKVDAREIRAKRGAVLLQACLESGIYIPHLCYIEGLPRPQASCRLCFVEIAGGDRPLPACTLHVEEGMVVRTDTDAVRRLQRSALRLLLSVHEVACARCPANKKCALQRIAGFLKVSLKPGKLDPILKESSEEDHPFLEFHPNRCVLCGKCVAMSRIKEGRPALTFAGRGFDTVISSYGGITGSDTGVEDFADYVDVCPVAAITFKGDRVTRG